MAIRVLASNNKHKINEFKEMFDEDKILSLNDIGFNSEIEENGTTFLILFLKIKIIWMLEELLAHVVI